MRWTRKYAPDHLTLSSGNSRTSSGPSQRHSFHSCKTCSNDSMETCTRLMTTSTWCLMRDLPLSKSWSSICRTRKVERSFIHLCGRSLLLRHQLILPKNRGRLVDWVTPDPMEAPWVSVFRMPCSTLVDVGNRPSVKTLCTIVVHRWWLS